MLVSLLDLTRHQVKCETKARHQFLQRIDDYKADLDPTVFAFD